MVVYSNFFMVKPRIFVYSQIHNVLQYTVKNLAGTLRICPTVSPGYRFGCFSAAKLLGPLRSGSVLSDYQIVSVSVEHDYQIIYKGPD